MLLVYLSNSAGSIIRPSAWRDTHILYCQLHLCCDNRLISLIRQWPISQAGRLWLVHHNPHAGYIGNCPPPELCLFLQQCDHKKCLLLMSVISCAKEKLKLWCYFLAIVHFSSCPKLHLSNYLIKVSIHKQHFFSFHILYHQSLYKLFMVRSVQSCNRVVTTKYAV